MVSTHILTAAGTAFLASLVEFVEALTVVLAIGTVRGWREAITGSVVGLLLLLAIVAVLGPALAQVPLAPLQIVVGILLILFGLRWLRKAILRAAGSIPLHDETAIFAHEAAKLSGIARTGAWDWIAFSSSLQITVLEGMEAVFIVIAAVAGGADMLGPAVLGALAALLLVIVLGIALRRPLASVPENTLKLLVGVMLSAFGTFWLGEGVNIAWPGRDLSLLLLTAAYLALAWLVTAACHRVVAQRGA